MEKTAYYELEKLQDSYWWFVGKRNIVISIVKQYASELIEKKGSEVKILDAGCGMGLLLRDLLSYGTVYGMDCEEKAVEYCKTFCGNNQVKVGMFPDNIPFLPQSFDIIVSADCLEHIGDDLEALKQLRRLLKNNNSFVVITVPAFMCLWSYNDIFVHHKRRYNRGQLIHTVEKAGLHLEFCSYYNFWAFPAVWLIRKFKNIFKIEEDDLKHGTRDGYINKILTQIFTSEKNHLLRKKQFPVGVSLLLVASRGKD